VQRTRRRRRVGGFGAHTPLWRAKRRGNGRVFADRSSLYRCHAERSQLGLGLDQRVICRLPETSSFFGLTPEPNCATLGVVR